jgi:cytochrome c-type biogenesis protein CcmH
VGNLLTFATLLLLAVPLHAGEARPAAADPLLETRLTRIAEELRCLVCQNQTIADSNSGLAIDLRNQVREMLQQGMSDQQVVRFMVERYGDFVLYRPPVKGSTWLLWFGPFLLFAGGLTLLVAKLRKRDRAVAPPLSQGEHELATHLLTEPRENRP